MNQNLSLLNVICVIMAAIGSMKRLPSSSWSDGWTGMDRAHVIAFQCMKQCISDASTSSTTPTPKKEARLGIIQPSPPFIPPIHRL
mmetsp:Transcript_8088/g.23256  ORF Transcript_8088/g.23256 Transcript_8088/m.23256 type:complete len:86 (+) Transcript_8088:149-406(+)